MNEYSSNVYMRIADMLSVFAEKENGITIDWLAEKYEVPSAVILEDLRYLTEAEELDFMIYLTDDRFDDDNEVYDDLIAGKYNDCEIAGSNNKDLRENVVLSLQLSKFERIFLSSFLKQNKMEARIPVKDDFIVKKLYQTTNYDISVLESINQAIREKKSVKFRYAGRNQGKKELCVMPVKVVKFLNDELFYVVAYVHGEIFYYRGDRIKQILGICENEQNVDTEVIQKALDEFTYRWGMGASEPPFEFQMIVYDEVRLPQRLEKELQNRKYGKWEKMEDGNYLYCDQVIDYNSLKSWVMELGSSVRVLQPQKLVNDIIESARARKSDYEKRFGYKENEDETI